MRVVYVSTVDRGGPITHLRSLAPAVQQAGADVRVICQSEALGRLFDGTSVDVQVTPVRSKWDVNGVRRLVAALSGADVVHAHDRRAALFALPAARARGARAVYTYHGLPEDFAPLVGRPHGPASAEIPWARRAWVLGGLLPLEGWLSRLGAVVVPSQALADFLAEHSFPPERVKVLPYGIDLPKTGGLAPSDGASQAEDEGTKPLRVGTAAILIPRKAVDVMLRACARVRPPLHVDVFGDGPLRPALEREAEQLGLDATFHGLVPDVRERMADLDVFILSTFGDNLPVAILEAMAAGLPVIASRTGGIPEQVVDGETGYLVEPGDVDGLSAAIERLASDPARRLSFGLAARERAHRYFSSEDVARRMIELYGALCASSM